MTDTERQLIDLFFDGQLPRGDAARLVQRLEADAEELAWFADRALLHADLRRSLQRRAVQTQALAEGVTTDRAGGAPRGTGSPASGSLPGPAHLLRRLKRGWMIAAALLVAVLALLVANWDRRAVASAATLVRAALVTHAEPVERVYLVETERLAAADAGFSLPRDVRVATQGDRFWVEMNGVRRWAWGRDADGAIWLTLGPRRAVRVEADEVGLPLQSISNLYTLELETLLQNFLKHCRLTRSEDNDSSYRIDVAPRSRWRGGWFKHATIDVDRETKAIRRLVIEREMPQRGSSTVTFLLVDSRTPDESKYHPEGHLTEPFRLLTRDVQPDPRRELMTNWFGPHAERWIQGADHDSDRR